MSRGLNALLQDRRSNLAEGLTMMSPAANQYDGGGFGRDPGFGAGVGADLRVARERLGWTLPAVAAHLRIRLPYLEAIEDGRLDELPGNAYAVGFLRAYAKAVGLDPDEISRRFRAETADLNNKTKLRFPAPVPERGVPAGAVVLVGLVLVVAAYIGWYRFSGNREPSVEITQAVPERLVPLDGMAADGTPKPVIIPPPPVPVLVPTAPQVAMVATAPNPPPVPAVPAAADGGRLIIRAKGDAWVQVRDKAGPVVFNRTMRAGETWPVPNKPGLLLTVGNAGGTEVLLDGVPTASLGAEGAVRRDLPLDFDQVQSGKLAAATPNSTVPMPSPPIASKPAAPKLP
jgi:cytoskeleton protein RodZ